jgi:hypothetical protein
VKEGCREAIQTSEENKTSVKMIWILIILTATKLRHPKNGKWE